MLQALGYLLHQATERTSIDGVGNLGRGARRNSRRLHPALSAQYSRTVPDFITFVVRSMVSCVMMHVGLQWAMSGRADAHEPVPIRVELLLHASAELAQAVTLQAFITFIHSRAARTGQKFSRVAT
jgi:hypothetical protein